MERNSRNLIKMLRNDGWKIDRVNGSHHIFEHPTKSGYVIVPHPRRDLPIGTVHSIYKAAGWKKKEA